MVTTEEVKRNITRGDAWLRIFFIIVFAFIYGVVNWVLAAVVVVQAGWSLITSTPSERLCAFGASIGEYLRQIARFVTFDSDHKPFPFSEWPDGEAGDTT